ncbi:MFS transporter [Bartonella sp. DGB2]|uniref:MFS transporter n=1 Tax=Bartonella sp. DGB2 TaxID=3388426 RepID=UPI00399016A0
MIGLASSAVQILVPYAAYLAPEDRRGSTVGNVMSGLMAGIMLARPFASFLAEFWSWHIVFYVSSAILLFVFFILFLFLPPKIPTSKYNYLSLLLSMVKLWKQHAILRRRATYHAFLFCAFSLFWTTAPLFLMGAPYNFSQGEIALFAFAGAAGIFAAPIAGRLSDKGLFYQATSMAMLLVGICFFLAGLIFFTPKIGVFLLCIAAISLDFGVTTNLVIGQKIIYSLGAEARGRINGLYMVVFFIGGAIGSALGGFIYSRFGWGGIVILGLIITFMVATYYYTERYAKNS